MKEEQEIGITEHIEAVSTSAVGQGGPPEADHMKNNALVSMAYGSTPLIKKASGQGFNSPAPSAALARRKLLERLVEFGVGGDEANVLRIVLGIRTCDIDGA